MSLCPCSSGVQEIVPVAIPAPSSLLKLNCQKSVSQSHCNLEVHNGPLPPFPAAAHSVGGLRPVQGLGMPSKCSMLANPSPPV